MTQPIYNNLIIGYNPFEKELTKVRKSTKRSSSRVGGPTPNVLFIDDKEQLTRVAPMSKVRQHQVSSTAASADPDLSDS